MNTAIEVHHLVKKYGDVTAVDDVSFEVAVGSKFAFLGTNGAGKSTTINCLISILAPTSGEVTVAGHTLGREDDDIRRRIGVVFQESLLDPKLTVRENLGLRARFYRLSKAETTQRIGHLAGLMDLDGFLDRRYGNLSGGQKRRTDIVRALLHSPDILFLDEPTTGLDPESRENVWNTVSQLQDTLGLTTFLTTHYMQETERSDKVCVLSAGRIVAEGTPAELRARYAGDELLLTLRPGAPDDLVLGENVVVKGDTRYVPVGSSEEALSILIEHRPHIADFEFRHGTMDDVFLNVTRQGGTK